MPRPLVLRTVARALIVAMLAAPLCASLVACGQRGPLYTPDKDNPDKRR